MARVHHPIQFQRWRSGLFPDHRKLRDEMPDMGFLLTGRANQLGMRRPGSPGSLAFASSSPESSKRACELFYMSFYLGLRMR